MWNPFRRAQTVQEEPCDSEPPPSVSLLPDYDDREDTQRIVTTLAEYRASKREGVEDLEETAESVKIETKRTLRSLLAFRAPPLAEEEPAE